MLQTEVEFKKVRKPRSNRKRRGNFYPTWRLAARAARKLGCRGFTDYGQRRRLNKRLPRDPYSYYSDFPGFAVFLGKKEKIGYYKNWQKASKVAIGLGISKKSDYLQRSNLDNRLPKYPEKYYKNFPGFLIFLGKKKRQWKGLYETWQEASLALKKVGIVTFTDYKKLYKSDVRLPSTPSQKYKDFPGWDIFLNRNIDNK